MTDQNLPRGSAGNPLDARELRLQQIRREAENGRIESSGVQPLNAPFPLASPGPVITACPSSKLQRGPGKYHFISLRAARRARQRL